jgi:predicted enzyme related to lactoylglutathione lyase
MTSLIMTKLVVSDLEASKRFYETVCALSESNRIDAVSDGRPITEVIMVSQTPGSAGLVLFNYRKGPAPAPGECMLVFDTDDLDGFYKRALGAGASPMEPPKSLPDLGLSYALVRDPEGHIVEAIQRHVATAAA